MIARVKYTIIVRVKLQMTSRRHYYRRCLAGNFLPLICLR